MEFNQQPKDRLRRLIGGLDGGFYRQRLTYTGVKQDYDLSRKAKSELVVVFLVLGYSHCEKLFALF